MKPPLRAAALAVALAAAGPAAWAATHTVVVEDMRFQPGALTVRRGDRITWVNRDVVPHTATAAKGFDSGTIAPGASWSFTVKKTGQLDYVCVLHPMMKARLTVN